MQRSILNKNPILAIFYLVLFLVYESLTSIYLFLPPLFALFFVLFIQAIKKENIFLIFYISLFLFIFETDKGYMAFSSIIYFILVYKFILPKVVQNFSCVFCIKISYVLIAYIGFYIFTLFLAKVFMIPTPTINYYMLYYIIIEFFLVSLL